MLWYTTTPRVHHRHQVACHSACTASGCTIRVKHQSQHGCFDARCLTPPALLVNAVNSGTRHCRYPTVRSFCGHAVVDFVTTGIRAPISGTIPYSNFGTNLDTPIRCSFFSNGYLNPGNIITVNEAHSGLLFFFGSLVLSSPSFAG